MSSLNRQKVTLRHFSGVEFNVFLTPYEVSKSQEDDEFCQDLINKYYEIYRNGNIYGKSRDGGISIGGNQPPNNVYPSTSKSQQIAALEDNDELNYEDVPTAITVDHEEQLIGLVSERPALYDFRLPLKDRSKEMVRTLWEEIISEMNVRMSVDAISKKWKNIRDSYIRARSNIKKKLASGSSAAEKIDADRVRARHRNYNLLEFLDDSLTIRRTSSNLDSSEGDELESAPETGTSTSSGSSGRSSRDIKRCLEQEASLSAPDKAFLQAITTIGKPTSNSTKMTASEYFCMRLASSLERLTRRLRNNLEVKILQLVTEAENSLEDPS